MEDRLATQFRGITDDIAKLYGTFYAHGALIIVGIVIVIFGTFAAIITDDYSEWGSLTVYELLIVCGSGVAMIACGVAAIIRYYRYREKIISDATARFTLVINKQEQENSDNTEAAMKTESDAAKSPNTGIPSH